MWIWLCVFLRHFSLYHVRTHQSHLIMSQRITFWLTIILNQQIQCHVPHSKASVKHTQSRKCLDLLWMQHKGLPVLVAPQSFAKTSVPLCKTLINTVGGNFSFNKFANKAKQFDHANTHTHISAEQTSANLTGSQMSSPRNQAEVCAPLLVCEILQMIRGSGRLQLPMSRQ